VEIGTTKDTKSTKVEFDDLSNGIFPFMKLVGIKIGLLMKFIVTMVKKGIKSYVL
jgi:hypothetical protein